MKNLATYLKDKKMQKNEMLQIMGLAYDNLDLENEEDDTLYLNSVIKREDSSPRTSQVDPELVPTISSLFQKLRKQMYGKKRR